MSVDMTKGDAVTTVVPDLAAAYVVPRVNLLPPEIAAARALRRTQGVLGGCVLLVVGAITGAFVLSVQKADTAAEHLAAETAVTTELTAQEAEFARVPVVLAEVAAAETARETAMATDILWHRYLEQIAATYPPNVWLGNLTASVATPAVAAGAVVDPLAATSGIGSVTFTGTGITTPDVAAWMDVLDATPGLSDASLSAATRTDKEGLTVYDYSTAVVVTDTALSHRFDRRAS